MFAAPINFPPGNTRPAASAGLGSPQTIGFRVINPYSRRRSLLMPAPPVRGLRSSPPESVPVSPSDQNSRGSTLRSSSHYPPFLRKSLVHTLSETARYALPASSVHAHITTASSSNMHTPDCRLHALGYVRSHRHTPRQTSPSGATLLNQPVTEHTRLTSR